VAIHGSSIVGVRGLGSLQKLIISGDQLIDVAIPVLAERGIRVDDDYLSSLDGA
jgi:hypothetical protein